MMTDQGQQQKRGLFGQVFHWVDVKIFQYNVTFGLYMLDQWERWLFSILKSTVLQLLWPKD